MNWIPVDGYWNVFGSHRLEVNSRDVGILQFVDKLKPFCTIFFVFTKQMVIFERWVIETIYGSHYIRK